MDDFNKFIMEKHHEMLRLEYKSSLHLDLILIVLLVIAIVANIVLIFASETPGRMIFNAILLAINLTNLIFSIHRRVKARKSMRECEIYFKEKLDGTQ